MKSLPYLKLFCVVVTHSRAHYHCGTPDSSFKRNLRLCPTGNRILGVCISGRSLVYFIYLFICIVFDYSQPVWMLAETRLDNNCSLVIAKCWRNGLLVGRDFKTQWTITANMAFSIRLSVKKMYFPIIISVKRKTCLTLRTRKPFPSLYKITI